MAGGGGGDFLYIFQDFQGISCDYPLCHTQGVGTYILGFYRQGNSIVVDNGCILHNEFQEPVVAWDDGYGFLHNPLQSLAYKGMDGDTV